MDENEKTPIDHAWRSVDALGGRHEAQTDYERGYAAGYDRALELAMKEIERHGGRPS